MSKRDIFRDALKIRELTARHKATFIVNDHIDIALACGADGVHLGQEDVPVREARKIMGSRKIIGISTHNLTQAVTAEAEGADYIGYGPMYHTTTKNAGPARGPGRLREICRNITIPVVAIGGITWDNIKETLDAGADAAAIASGILSGNIKRNTFKFLEIIGR